MDLNGQFYYVKNNKPVGPFTLDELLEKGVSNKTYIWTKGMTNWEKIEAIPVILEKLNNNKPPVFIEPKSEDFNNSRKGKGVNKIILFAFLGIIVLVLGFIGFRLIKFTGEFIWPNGEKYVGEIIYGLPNGLGTQTWPDGKKYVGEFKDGKRNGQGTLTSISGDKYVGEFKNGETNGQGTLTLSNGDKYVGEYKDGNKNGQGTVTFSSGAKYVGEFKDDKYNGQGTLTLPNSTKIVGKFIDGLPNGQMTVLLPNGSKKYGEIKNGIIKYQEKLDNDALIKNPNIGTNSTLNNSSISEQVSTSIMTICDDGYAFKNKTVKFQAFYQAGEQVGDKWPLKSQGVDYERINSAINYGLTTGNETFYTRISYVSCKLILRIPYSINVPNATIGMFSIIGKVTTVGNSYVVVEVTSITRVY